ncbi:MAG: PAS domain S-box protein [Halarchaeum sp.]
MAARELLPLGAGHVVAFIGTVGLLLGVVDALVGYQQTADTVQAVYVSVASLGLLAGGVWLSFRDRRDAADRRILAWTLAGGGFLFVLAGLGVWTRTHSVAARNPTQMIVQLVVFGCLGGFVTGYFQDRAYQQRERANVHLEQFRTLVEQAPLPLVAVTTDGRVEMWNAAAEELFGYSADDVIGGPSPLVPPDRAGEFERHLDDISDGSVLDGVRTKRRRRDGTLLDVELWAKPIPDSRDGDTLALGVFRDLTDEAILEEQRTVMQRIFRHNLRNDLSIIDGYAARIAERGDGALVEYAETIDRAANRLSSLSERVNGLELESTIRARNVVAFVESAATTVREAHPEATVVVEAPAEAWVQTVPAIGDAFEEAIENGIVHAAAASPTVTVRVTRADGFVEVAVGDEGPGIPDAEWAPIVERTEEPLAHASGLGLWMMHWAAARSGGTLTKRDRPEGGTTVVFSLPRTLSQMPARAERDSESTGADDGET